MKVLVTGCAGFIGFHAARRLLERGDSVIGLDSVNDYYDPRLKEARLNQLFALASAGGSRFDFFRADLNDPTALGGCFSSGIERVIHLAAQAGVRYSLESPRSYVESNVAGFAALLEACRCHEVPHLTYASTSSVYGANAHMPFSEHEPADHPLQFYAATKRANELMAHSYSHLFRLPTTGLRFFTVYGPWGRPDMALFLFTKAILAGEPVRLFNMGRHSRDFTYVDDIVEGIVRASDDVARPESAWTGERPDPATSSAPWRIFNIGAGRPVRLEAYLDALENALGKRAIREYVQAQPGDVPDTFADISAFELAVGYRPTVSVEEGVRRFAEWYLTYYGRPD